MKIFNLNKKYNIVCNSEGTRYGFRHVATLHKNGFSIAREKVCYYNRTWERWEFETVIISIIEKHFTGNEKTKFLNKVKSIENW
jgi:hypothetical protein